MQKLEGIEDSEYFALSQGKQYMFTVTWAQRRVRAECSQNERVIFTFPLEVTQLYVCQQEH